MLAYFYVVSNMVVSKENMISVLEQTGIIKEKEDEKMQIRLYGSYAFTDDSDFCCDNGDLTILYNVPKSWKNWSEERREEWLLKNYNKINKAFKDAMYVSYSHGGYDDIDEYGGGK